VVWRVSISSVMAEREKAINLAQGLNLFGGELGSETRSHCFVGAEKPSKCYFLFCF